MQQCCCCTRYYRLLCNRCPQFCYCFDLVAQPACFAHRAQRLTATNSHFTPHVLCVWLIVVFLLMRAGKKNREEEEEEEVVWVPVMGGRDHMNW